MSWKLDEEVKDFESRNTELTTNVINVPKYSSVRKITGILNLPSSHDNHNVSEV